MMPGASRRNSRDGIRVGGWDMSGILGPFALKANRWRNLQGRPFEEGPVTSRACVASAVRR